MPHHHILLIELHVGNAVHQKSARAIGSLEHRHRMAGTIQLLCSSKSGGAGADDGYLLASAGLRRLGNNPTLLEATLDDRVLDVLDRDRRRVDAKYARPFARRRTHAPGELRKVIGLVQTIERLTPQTSIDQIVPLGDEVVDGAACGSTTDHLAGVAKRHTTIHATCCLVAQAAIIEMVMELAPILDPLDR